MAQRALTSVGIQWCRWDVMPRLTRSGEELVFGGGPSPPKYQKPFRYNGARAAFRVRRSHDRSIAGMSAVDEISAWFRCGDCPAVEIFAAWRMVDIIQHQDMTRNALRHCRKLMYLGFCRRILDWRRTHTCKMKDTVPSHRALGWLTEQTTQY